MDIRHRGLSLKIQRGTCHQPLAKRHLLVRGDMTRDREIFQQAVEALLDLLADQEANNASWMVECISARGCYWRFAGLLREGYWLHFSGLGGSATRDPATAIDDLTRELLRFSLNSNLHCYAGRQTTAPSIQAEAASGTVQSDALTLWIELDDWVDHERRAVLRTRLAFTGSVFDVNTPQRSHLATGGEPQDNNIWCRNRRFIEGAHHNDLVERNSFTI